MAEKTIIKINPDLHSRFKVFAANTSETMSALSEKWIAEGMDGKMSPHRDVLEGLTSVQKRLVETYASLLRSGAEPALMDAISKILRFSAESGSMGDHSTPKRSRLLV